MAAGTHSADLGIGPAVAPGSGAGALVLGHSQAVAKPNAGDLQLRGPATERADLVLGYPESAAPALPDVPITAAAQLPGLRCRGGALRVAAALQARAAFPALAAVGELRYQSVTQRPVVGKAATDWQVAAAHTGGQSTAQHSSTAHLPTGSAAPWQSAAQAAAPVAHPLPDVLRSHQAPSSAPWQAAQRAGTAAAWPHQSASARPLAAAAPWQAGAGLRLGTWFGQQDGTRTHACRVAPWQLARALPVLRRTCHQLGTPALQRRRQRWQPGRPPPAGMTVYVPPGKPKPPPCFDPAQAGHIVFTARADGSGHLVFVCRRTGPAPQPPRWVIPKLEVYVSAHEINAWTVPGHEPLALTDCSISTDDGSFGWQLSASGPEQLMEQLAPVGGLPARLCVQIDGHDWIFAVESVGRSRKFGQHRASITGRSVTALLGEPYMPAGTHSNAAQATAQQLLQAALEFTGTALDWDIADWLVPAGAWSFQGTPLQAALRIAESAGAVLRSHRTAQRLQLAPRYPVLPWQWAAAVPDVQLPADVILTDELRPDPQPAYNAVYVGGQAQGVLGHVRRAGTAGDVLAPQVTDALITDIAAARQRGAAVLGAAGNRYSQRMTLPFLTGTALPGPIAPGALIEVLDLGGERWRGLVRGINITAGLPAVRQSITVERHATA